jgi:type IV pilus assembly protein PilC
VSPFSFVALDAHGVETRGELQARDERDARNQLRARCLRPVLLVQGALPDSLGWAQRGVQLVESALPRAWLPARPADLAALFRQLALMLRAGHALAQALDAAQQLHVKHAVRALVAYLADALRGGQPLSQAMRSRGRPFTPLMTQLTASAEQAGELDLVFERMADDLERKRELQRQVLSTMLYPVIVLLTAIGVFVFLAVSVLPRFAGFIEGRGRQVPAEARLLLELSTWMEQYGAWLGMGVLGLLAFLALAWHLAPTRRVLDRLVLALPVLGGLVRDANMTRVAWTLSLLVRSGTTALDALRVVRHVAGNHVYASVFDEAERRLLSGVALSKALNQRPVPHLLRHMVAVGEGTGQLDLVLESVAMHFRRNLEARIKLLTSLIEPALLLVVGCVVGFVYYTFFKTLMSAGGGG